MDNHQCRIDGRTGWSATVVERINGHWEFELQNLQRPLLYISGELR